MTEPMELEFKEGDVITYKPYEKELKAKIKKAEITTWHISGVTEPEYTLSGIGTKFSESVCGKTTGKSIMESKYFKPWDGKD